MFRSVAHLSYGIPRAADLEDAVGDVVYDEHHTEHSAVTTVRLNRDVLSHHNCPVAWTAGDVCPLLLIRCRDRRHASAERSIKEGS